MAWGSNKEKESRTLNCPFCDEGDIKTIFYPETKNDNLTTTVGGRRFKSFSCMNR